MKNLLQQYLFTFITDELKPSITIPAGTTMSNNISTEASNRLGVSELYVYRIKNVKKPPAHRLVGNVNAPTTYSLFLKEATVGVPVYKLTMERDGFFSIDPIDKKALSDYDEEASDNHLLKELDKVFIVHEDYKGAQIQKVGKYSKRVYLKFNWNRNRMKPNDLHMVQVDARYMVDLSRDLIKYVKDATTVRAKRFGSYYIIRLDYDIVVEKHGKKEEVK